MRWPKQLVIKKTKARRRTGANRFTYQTRSLLKKRGWEERDNQEGKEGDGREQGIRIRKIDRSMKCRNWVTTLKNRGTDVDCNGFDKRKKWLGLGMNAAYALSGQNCSNFCCSQ